MSKSDTVSEAMIATVLGRKRPCDATAMVATRHAGDMDALASLCIRSRQPGSMRLLYMDGIDEVIEQERFEASDHAPLSEDLPDNRDDMEATSNRGPISKAISEVLDELTDRESIVIRMRFGIDKTKVYTLEEVGFHLNVTRERVRQIESKALKKLQHPCRSCHIERFLNGHHDISADAQRDNETHRGMSLRFGTASSRKNIFEICPNDINDIINRSLIKEERRIAKIVNENDRKRAIWRNEDVMRLVMESRRKELRILQLKRAQEEAEEADKPERALLISDDELRKKRMMEVWDLFHSFYKSWNKNGQKLTVTRYGHGIMRAWFKYLKAMQRLSHLLNGIPGMNAELQSLAPKRHPHVIRQSEIAAKRAMAVLGA